MNYKWFGRINSEEELKQAYRRLAKEYHPDRRDGKKTQAKATADMQKINAERDAILDMLRRGGEINQVAPRQDHKTSQDNFKGERYNPAAKHGRMDSEPRRTKYQDARRPDNYDRPAYNDWGTPPAAPYKSKSKKKNAPPVMSDKDWDRFWDRWFPAQTSQWMDDEVSSAELHQHPYTGSGSKTPWGSYIAVIIMIAAVVVLFYH